MPTTSDRAVAEALARYGGWSVLLTGWPDILAYSHERGTVMAVELKRGNDKMRPDQIEMSRVFKEILGVPFYVARDDDIAKVMNRRGRMMLPGTKIAVLQGQAASLELQLRLLTRELERLNACVQQTSVVFEDGLDPQWSEVSTAVLD